MFLTTWSGDRSYTGVTWTMTPELYCSFMAMGLAFIAVNINQRWILYICVFSFCQLQNHYSDHGGDSLSMNLFD